MDESQKAALLEIKRIIEYNRGTFLDAPYATGLKRIPGLLDEALTDDRASELVDALEMLLKETHDSVGKFKPSLYKHCKAVHAKAKGELTDVQSPHHDP